MRGELCWKNYRIHFSFSYGFLFTVFPDWKPSTKVYTHKKLIRLLCNGKTWSSANITTQKYAKIQSLRNIHPVKIKVLTGCEKNYAGRTIQVLEDHVG